MSYGTQTPHIAAYVIFRNQEGKVAFLLRSGTGWMDDYYGLPAGKTEVDENFINCAIREAKEEVGVDVTEKQLNFLLTMHRHEIDDNTPLWVDVFFEASKWTGELSNVESDKHSKLEWLDTDNLPDNVIPSVAAALHAINKGQHYFEYGWES